MNKKILAMILIVASGSILSGLAYANTVITDTSISTSDLTVTGTCTGCGGGEGSFTTWSTQLNETVAGTTAGTNIGLQVGTDGSIIGTDSNSESYAVKLDGTVITVKAISSGFDSAQVHAMQSPQGEYKVILSDVDGGVDVYKNNTFLLTIGIDVTQFSASNFSKASVAISSDGKYIAVAGSDVGASFQRLLVFQGS